MEKVIGYYADYGKNLLGDYGMTMEDFLSSTCEWKAGYVTSEGKFNKSIDSFDIEMLNGNKTTIADYCKDTGIVRIMFEIPIPLKVLNAVETKNRMIPIFEGTKAFLNLKTEVVKEKKNVHPAWIA